MSFLQLVGAIFLGTMLFPAPSDAGVPDSQAMKVVEVAKSNSIFLDGAKVLENISSVARTGTQAQLDSTMAELYRKGPIIFAQLSAEKRTEFIHLVDALKQACKRNSRSDLLLYSMEGYRFLMAQMQPTKSASQTHPDLANHPGRRARPSGDALAKKEGASIERLRPPLVAAHRAGEFGLPNTLVQVAKALDSDDADIIEMDLRLTSDGKVVVFHDDTLGTKTECAGRVEDTTYMELLECKLNNGERIALFSDVLDLVNGRKLISAELKTDAVAMPASRLVLNSLAANWVYFQVGDSQHRYQLVRGVSPQLAMMANANSEASLRWILAANDPSLKIVQIDRDAVSQELVRDLHAHHKLVTLDTWRFQFTEERFVASCDQAFESGIDIAVTNNPASCRQQARAPSHQPGGNSSFYDRRHVRAWARVHPGTVHWLKITVLFLLPTLAIGILLWKGTQSLRLSRAGPGYPAGLASVTWHGSRTRLARLSSMAGL